MLPFSSKLVLEAVRGLKEAAEKEDSTRVTKSYPLSIISSVEQLSNSEASVAFPPSDVVVANESDVAPLCASASDEVALRLANVVAAAGHDHEGAQVQLQRRDSHKFQRTVCQGDVANKVCDQNAAAEQRPLLEAVRPELRSVLEPVNVDDDDQDDGVKKYDGLFFTSEVVEVDDDEAATTTVEAAECPGGRRSGCLYRY